jgi:hypothetical protein
MTLWAAPLSQEEGRLNRLSMPRLASSEYCEFKREVDMTLVFGSPSARRLGRRHHDPVDYKSGLTSWLF